MSRFMLRIASHLLHRITDRRCPSCGRVEVRRSARKNFFEAALLPFLLTRPFRCENCGNRFCGLAFRRRVPPPHYAKPMSDLPQDLPVLVYGLRTREGRRAFSGRDKCPSVESSWRTYHPSHKRGAWATTHSDESGH